MVEEQNATSRSTIRKEILVIVLMGVSGSGKTSVGSRLAERIGWTFLDADDLHSRKDVVRMSEGYPLTERDRLPWAKRVRTTLDGQLCAGKRIVLACSALTGDVQSRLGLDRPEVRTVHLAPPKDELWKRLEARSAHFFPSSLLQSQLDVIDRRETSMTIKNGRISDIVDRICEELGLSI